MKKFIAVFIFGTLFIAVLAMAFMILFGKIKTKSPVFGQLIPTATSTYSTSSRYNVGVSNWFPQSNTSSTSVYNQSLIPVDGSANK
jgi:hypothetical protein